MAVTHPAVGTAIRLAGWGWPLIRERRRQAVIVVCLSLAASALGLAQPYLTRILIDEGAMRGNPAAMAWACGLMAVATLLGVGIESRSRFDYLALSSHVLFRLRESLFTQLQSMPPAFFTRVGQGDILARYDGDVAEIQRFFVDAPLALVGAIFSLLVGTCLMWSMSPLLALLVLFLAPLQVLAGLGGTSRLEAGAREVRDQAGRLSGHFLDSLRAIKFVQNTNTESIRLDGLRHLHQEYYEALVNNQRIGFRQNARRRLVAAFANLVLVAAGTYFLSVGTVSVGVLVSFIVLSSRVTAPLQTMAGVWSGWRRSRVSLGRLAEFFPARPAKPEAPAEAAGAVPEFTGDIVLDRVSFAYEPGHPILDAASMRIVGGGKTLLLGASGEGKSTIIDLLLGHLRPDGGAVRIGNEPLGRFDLGALRRRIAVVDQEPVFFTSTVGQNLRHVAPQASDEELLAALAASGYGRAPLAAEVLDVPVGATAARLSRGQRMRLALARALLQRPDFLILDETTSAVDSAMARRMMDSIDELFPAITRLVITHQPEAAGPCQAAYVLRAGRTEALPAVPLAMEAGA